MGAMHLPRGKRAWSVERAGSPQRLGLAPLARRAPRSLYFALWIVLLAVLTPSLGAQTTVDRIREQREELERIRREREQLRKRMSELQGSVHSLAEEVSNLDRQADATARAVKSLDAQLGYIAEQVGTTNESLQTAQQEIGTKQRILRRRLVDIYKRGPLYSYEALLSAESFGALVARYKYLHLLTLRDRALVKRVEQLRDRIAGERATLVRLQADIERSRLEKQEEEERLRALESQRQLSLRQTRAQTKALAARIARIERSEARLSSVISSFEAARRRAEARRDAPAAASASTLTTRDLGRLDWPVDGTILYRFGRVVNPNNTTTRWNGIGIAAASGTPVRAISAGEVVVAEPIGTYGLTVIVQHGGGDYSVYGSLSRTEVRRGQNVRKGQTVGAVGAADPDLEAHLHFEIRRGRGVAVDPLEWLRRAAR